MLNPLVPKFRLDLSVGSKDIAEKQVPAKLKPIVGQDSIGQGRGSIQHGESKKWHETGQGMTRKRRGQSMAVCNRTRRSLDTSATVELVTQRS